METYVTIDKKSDNIFYYCFYDYEKERLVEFQKKQETTNGQELFKLLEHCMKVCIRRKIKQVIIVSHLTTYRKILAHLENVKKVHEKKVRKILQLKKQFELFKYTYQEREELKNIPNEKPILPLGYEAVVYSDISNKNDTKQSSIAGILYDDKGTVLEKVAMAVPYQKNTANLERLALLEMMKKVKEKRFNKVLFRTDLEATINYIKNPYKKRQPENMLKIKEFLEEYPQWTVEKIHRKYNKEADELARKVLNLKQRES